MPRSTPIKQTEGIHRDPVPLAKENLVNGQPSSPSLATKQGEKPVQKKEKKRARVSFSTDRLEDVRYYNKSGRASDVGLVNQTVDTAGTKRAPGDAPNETGSLQSQLKRRRLSPVPFAVQSASKGIQSKDVSDLLDALLPETQQGTLTVDAFLSISPE